MEKIFQANEPEKQTGAAILVCNEVEFKSKLIKRNRETHFVLIKGRMHEDDLSILNTCAPNIGIQYSKINTNKT